jgi:hypothetical protein
MRNLACLLLAFALLHTSAFGAFQQTYLGFDRNGYPGDAVLPTLRKSFRYTSYWLNNPPGDNRNSWIGKRSLLKAQGFGFLVLFNGRLDGQLKGIDGAAAGKMDGNAAVLAAKKEGFNANVRIFLDQEEGGASFPNRLRIYFLGSIPWRARVPVQEFTVPGSTSQMETALSARREMFFHARKCDLHHPPKPPTLEILPGKRWLCGSPMINVLHPRAVLARKSRPQRPCLRQN